MFRNITNGEIDLPLGDEDIAPPANKLIRAPMHRGSSSVRPDTDSTKYFMENIRTGTFSEVSQSYLEETIQLSNGRSKQSTFTGDSFQLELDLSIAAFNQQLIRMVTFTQGLFAGTCLFYAITLSLSERVTGGMVRVQDHLVRISSMVSAFGALYTLGLARKACKLKIWFQVQANE